MIWAGFILGLLSSLHCIGMCGPLVLALPGGNKPVTRRWFNRFNYHLGRIIVYGLIGSIAGLIGNGLELFTWQRSVALAGGVAMIIFALAPSLVHNLRLRGRTASSISSMRTRVLKSLEHEDLFSWVGLGALNALLPCGAIFVALAGSLAMGNFAGGALFMILFGMGTALSLLLIHLIKDKIHLNTTLFSRLAPWIMASLGLLLLLRGMDLGIPYLSPSFNLEAGSANGCHIPLN